jgi:lipoprotein-releasing system permease protein
MGTAICLVQQQFGLVKINAEGGSFLISAYPVLMKFSDFFYVFITVSLIGLLAAWVPVRNIGKIDSRLAAMHSR